MAYAAALGAGNDASGLVQPVVQSPGLFDSFVNWAAGIDAAGTANTSAQLAALVTDQYNRGLLTQAQAQAQLNTLQAGDIGTYQSLPGNSPTGTFVTGVGESLTGFGSNLSTGLKWGLIAGGVLLAGYLIFNVEKVAGPARDMSGRRNDRSSNDYY